MMATANTDKQARVVFDWMIDTVQHIGRGYTLTVCFKDGSDYTKNSESIDVLIDDLCEIPSSTINSVSISPKIDG